MTDYEVDPYEHMVPENVGKAIKILASHPDVVSPKDLAKSLGVPKKHFMKWVERSREHREEEDPWIWELAEVYDKRMKLQDEMLENVSISTGSILNTSESKERVAFELFRYLHKMEVITGEKNISTDESFDLYRKCLRVVNGLEEK